MTLTDPRLVTTSALLVIVLTVAFLTRCNDQRADDAPAVAPTDATPLPNPGLFNPWRTVKPVRPDPTAAVAGGVPAGMASDAAAAVAAAEATATNPAKR